MINSIPTIESKKNNTFGDMTKKKLPSDYWLSLPADTYTAHKDKNKLKITIMTPDEAQETNNAKLIGLSIAGATVLTAAALFFLLKGGPKGMSKNFQKFRDFLENKIQKSKLDNTGNPKKVNKAYVFMIKKLDVVLQKFEAVNNFTTIKDMLFKKLMFNKLTGGFTGKIHDGITRMFERIGRQSVVNSYKKTISRIAETKTLCQNIGKNVLAGNSSEIIEINGIRQTKAQWLARVSQMDENLVQTYEKHFGKNTLTSRYLKIKKACEDLKAHFEKLNIFWSKDVINSFMAESAIAKEKSAIQKIVRGHRKNLSYSLADLAKDSENKIIKMTQSISYKDIEKINMLRGLRQNIKMYAKAGTGNEILSSKILNGMEDFRNEILTSLKNKSIDEKIAQSLLDGIGELKTSFTSFKQGSVEDILDIYKKILPQNEYEIIEKAYKSNVKALDKSINIETEEFISKIRDLSLGSAPTDILTILGSLGTLGYYLGKSDDNEQRTSVSLKYGIPAMAGIGVSLYCNAKLFAGTKSLLIGSISTLIVNKIGTWADNMLKKHRAEKKAAAQKTNNTQPENKTLDLTIPQPTAGLKQKEPIKAA